MPTCVIVCPWGFSPAWMGLFRIPSFIMSLTRHRLSRFYDHLLVVHKKSVPHQPHFNLFILPCFFGLGIQHFYFVLYHLWELFTYSKCLGCFGSDKLAVFNFFTFAMMGLRLASTDVLSRGQIRWNPIGLSICFSVSRRVSNVFFVFFDIFMFAFPQINYIDACKNEIVAHTTTLEVRHCNFKF